MKSHVAYCIDLYYLSVGLDSDMLYLYLTISPVACVKLCCQWFSGRHLHLELSVATFFSFFLLTLNHHSVKTG